MSWDLNDMPSLVGRRVLVTGANSGIGYFAAVELARHGAVVVMACRDRAKGEAALARLKVDAAGAASAAGQAELVLLDLASLASVRAVAEAELAKRLALDCLINNAGVMAPPRRRETADGLEVQLGTNVVGHFALTGLLLPALERAQAARVVTVASIAHKQGRINFEDLQSLRRYNPMTSYQQSKLGNVLFTLELERRLRAAGSRAISLGVHPGVAKTELFKIGSGKPAKLLEKVVRESIGLLLNSETDGALPTLYAATATDAVGGGYYGPQGFQETRGGDVGPARVAKQALDQAVQRRLWSVCEELSGVRYLDGA